MPACPDTVTLMLAGDVMTGRAIDKVLAHPVPAQPFGPPERDVRRNLLAAARLHGRVPRRVPDDYVWGEALAQIAPLSPALRIVNLGTAITTASTAWAGKRTHCRMNPANIGCLTAAAISGCTLANDRALDWDYPGLRETLGCLNAAGIACTGAGLDAGHAAEAARFALPGGGRLLLFSWATPTALPAGWAATAARPGVATLPGLGEADAVEIRKAVERERRSGDLVVVSLHWGERDARSVTSGQREFAQRLIHLKAADVVHGHHALAPLPMEVHQGRLILYACGDLVTDTEGLPTAPGQRADAACSYAVTLSRKDGALVDLQVLPFQRRRFQLRTPDNETRKWLRHRLNSAGHELGTSIVCDPEDRWRLSWRR